MNTELQMLYEAPVRTEAQQSEMLTLPRKFLAWTKCIQI